MEVTCALCGKKIMISKTHKDYHKLTKNPNHIYFCEMCQAKLQHNANEFQKPKKPIG